MLDRILNPSPTIRKWDNFWVGLALALVMPVLSFFIFFAFTYLTSVYVEHRAYSFRLFYMSATMSGTFLRTATLCCIPNAGAFFLLIQRNYINAPRAIVISTMLLIIGIVFKDML